jgi:hypothetical protein
LDYILDCIQIQDGRRVAADHSAYAEISCYGGLANPDAFVWAIPVSGVAARVSYASRTAQGGNASAIVSASGTNSVCILDPRQAGSAIITASLVAVNSGAALATCELLVSVAASGVEQTYINYSGDTIITIEKGVTKTLKATLAGANAAAADSKSLQWKSSDPSVVKVAPASVSGVAVNDEVQIYSPRLFNKRKVFTVRRSNREFHYRRRGADEFFPCFPGSQ